MDDVCPPSALLLLNYFLLHYVLLHYFLLHYFLLHYAETKRALLNGSRFSFSH